MPLEQMSVRLELFVQDMDQAIAFYSHIPGFEVRGQEEDYASLRNGAFLLGLGPIAKLPAESGGYFTRSRLQSDPRDAQRDESRQAVKKGTQTKEGKSL